MNVLAARDDDGATVGRYLLGTRGHSGIPMRKKDWFRC
jgi:hypothetical protein